MNLLRFINLSCWDSDALKHFKDSFWFMNQNQIYPTLTLTVKNVNKHEARCTASSMVSSTLRTFLTNCMFVCVFFFRLFFWVGLRQHWKVQMRNTERGKTKKKTKPAKDICQNWVRSSSAPVCFVFGPALFWGCGGERIPANGGNGKTMTTVLMMMLFVVGPKGRGLPMGKSRHVNIANTQRHNAKDCCWFFLLLYCSIHVHSATCATKRNTC